VKPLKQGNKNMDTLISDLGGYWTAIETVAAGIVLFVIGRRLVKKL